MVTKELLIRLRDQCDSCKKKKAKLPKARCQIWYGVFMSRSPVALDNLDKFLNAEGGCKGFEGYGKDQ